MQQLHWTNHAKAKMMHYRLTPSRVRRVLHSPNRIEEGVAPMTVAMMQPASLVKVATWTQEIWVMVQDVGKIRRVISAWRYPGVTKPRAGLPSFLAREYEEFLEKGGTD
jgi:hypothetical protein